MLIVDVFDSKCFCYALGIICKRMPNYLFLWKGLSKSLCNFGIGRFEPIKNIYFFSRGDLNDCGFINFLEFGLSHDWLSINSEDISTCDIIEDSIKALSVLLNPYHIFFFDAQIRKTDVF